MKSFSARLHTKARAAAKVNNSVGAVPAKAEIRRRVLNVIRADNAAVFDAFAGEGHMHSLVWHQAHTYAGCDKLWYRDKRLMYVADNRRVMRAIDLANFNIFDFDSWGSPWELVAILCARRSLAPGERLGLILTEGSSLKTRMGALPFGLAQLGGFKPDTPGTSRARDFVVERAIAETTRRLGAQLLHRWEARGRTGAKMVYIGLVLEGLATAKMAA